MFKFLVGVFISLSLHMIIELVHSVQCLLLLLEFGLMFYAVKL